MKVFSVETTCEECGHIESSTVYIRIDNDAEKEAGIKKALIKLNETIGLTTCVVCRKLTHKLLAETAKEV